MTIKRNLGKLLVLGPIGAAKILFRKFFWEEGFKIFEKLGLHVLPVHFYSPVPDTRQLRRNLHQWNKDWDFTGIDFKEDQQIQLLRNLAEFRSEYSALAEYDIIERMGLGEGYGEVESHLLYGVIRHFRPKRIIEVGSGISTYYSIAALRKNRDNEHIDSRIICIEPFPRKSLFKLVDNSMTELVPRFLQDCNLELFKTLKENDILFIDSSHIAKINSDVYHLYLEILPNLNSGVIIHIHDIPFPRITPHDVEHWIFKKHQFWNESAILKAFLSFNTSFEILLCSSYLHYKKSEILCSTFSIYNKEKHFPTAIWLRKLN